MFHEIHPDRNFGSNWNTNGNFNVGSKVEETLWWLVDQLLIMRRWQWWWRWQRWWRRWWLFQLQTGPMHRASPISIAEWTIHCYTLSWGKTQRIKGQIHTLLGEIQHTNTHPIFCSHFSNGFPCKNSASMSCMSFASTFWGLQPPQLFLGYRIIHELFVKIDSRFVLTDSWGPIPNGQTTFSIFDLEHGRHRKTCHFQSNYSKEKKLKDAA